MERELSQILRGRRVDMPRQRCRNPGFSEGIGKSSRTGELDETVETYACAPDSLGVITCGKIEQLDLNIPDSSR